SVEILWSSGNGSKSLRERLWMAKVERTPIVLRARNTEGWLTDQVNSFNRQSETYHVVVEDCGLGNDVEDFARLTSVQLASGKGPDIIYSSLMKDYMPGLMEKGALEDLRPYMERSGIRQEDYFPFTFGTWKNGDGIYGVSPASPVLAGYCMDSAFLGITQEPDIETLIDVLLSSQEKAVFLKGYDSQELLELFLAGTDTLWGMVDWKKRSCDFSGKLFAQILEAAKRYGDREDAGEVSCLAKQRSFVDIFGFDDAAEREKEGTVICGTLFDDGCHVAVTSYSALAVNVNSPHKEGAWEFISFLLGETAQSASSGVPASRSAFGSWVEKQKARVAGGNAIHELRAKKLPDGSTVITGENIYTEADITDEIIAEFRETLEDARPYPLRTVPILDIIRDEAADYFSGSKSAGEAARLVTNRVQTYLDEGR
ncbi:MAG: extracellular solute-binding protein, partial [Dysosmobacter sp.]|nr:extracellular solute-binding protein [Dysosmobacter sp.]